MGVGGGESMQLNRGRVVVNGGRSRRGTIRHVGDGEW